MIFGDEKEPKSNCGEGKEEERDRDREIEILFAVSIEPEMLIEAPWP